MSDTSLRLFYIYHQKDEALFRAIHDCFAVARNNKTIIDVGELVLSPDQVNQENESTDLDESDFVLIFLSRDFLKEEYANGIYKQKILIANKLQEKNLLRIIPIYLRPLVDDMLQGTIYHGIQAYPAVIKAQYEDKSIAEFEGSQQDKVIAELVGNFLKTAPESKKKLNKKTRRRSIATDTKELEAKLKKALGRQFIIEQHIASGESAILYRGFDVILKRRVAIKVIKPWAGAERIKRMKGDPGEARSIYGLKHRNLMTIYEARLANKPKYIILEYISGSALSSVIRREGPQPLRKVQQFMLQLSEVLAAGHKMGFLHKNITPSNIMIDSELVPILAPFELIQSSSLLKRGQTTRDSLRYWSPEQIEGRKVDARADQFSLGLITYQMLTGKSLFDGTLPNEIMTNRNAIQKAPETISLSLNEMYCPTDLKKIVLRMLSQKPEDRFDSMADVHDAFERLMIPSINYTQVVQDSYRRCLKQGDFIQSFYSRLFELSPSAAAKFQEKGLMGESSEVNYKQRKKLRSAINMLVEYPNARIVNPKVLEKLALHHGNGEATLNISKIEYDYFKKALIETVKKYEKHDWTPQLEKSWQQTIQEGIDLMKKFATDF